VLYSQQIAASASRSLTSFQMAHGRLCYCYLANQTAQAALAFALGAAGRNGAMDAFALGAAPRSEDMHALAFGTAFLSDAVEFPAAAALPVREAFCFCECRAARMAAHTFVQIRVG
jgi:hypothetical protein